MPPLGRLAGLGCCWPVTSAGSGGRAGRRPDRSRRRRPVLVSTGWWVRRPVLRRLWRSPRRVRHHPGALRFGWLALPSIKPIEILIAARRHIAKVPVGVSPALMPTPSLSAWHRDSNSERRTYWQGSSPAFPFSNTPKGLPRCLLAPRRLWRAPPPRRTSHSTEASASGGAGHGRC